MRKIWAAICAALFVFAAGCGAERADAPAAKDGALPPLSVGLMPDVDSVPFIMARALGYFADEGVDVTLHSFKSAMDRDAAMQSGRIDGAVSDLLAAAFARAGGFDVRVTSRTEGDYRLVAGRGAAGDARALAGADIAVSRNTVIEYVTDRILAENGLAPDDVRKVSVPQIPARLELLKSGKLAAAALPEPMAAIAEAGGCRVLAGAEAMGVHPGVMVFSARAAAEKRDAIRAMYRAYNRAAAYLRTSPRDAYIDMVVEQSGFPGEARDALTLPAYRGAALPEARDVAEAAAWLKARGLVRDPVPYDALVAGDCLP